MTTIQNCFHVGFTRFGMTYAKTKLMDIHINPIKLMTGSCINMLLIMQGIPSPAFWVLSIDPCEDGIHDMWWLDLKKIYEM